MPSTVSGPMRCAAMAGSATPGGVPPACTLMAGAGFDYAVLPMGCDEIGIAGAIPMLGAASAAAARSRCRSGATGRGVTG